MKHLKKINELFEGDYDNFDELSPEQAYKELENEMDLPKSEDIKEEIEGIFEFIEKDGLNPYDMSFDEFYKWASEKFRLEYPKSFYETEFKNKVHNPNQIKLDLNENKKIKSFKQWS